MDSEKHKYFLVVNHNGNKTDFDCRLYTWQINVHGSLEVWTFEDEKRIDLLEKIAHFCAPYSVYPIYK